MNDNQENAIDPNKECLISNHTPFQQQIITPEKFIWKDSPSQLKDLWYFIICGLLSFLIIPFGLFVWRWLTNERTVYSLTSQRILISQGILNRVTEQVELYRVRDYELVEPFWLHVFGLSNIHILTVDQGRSYVNIFAVRNGSSVVDHIRNAVEKVRAEKAVRSIDYS